MVPTKLRMGIEIFCSLIVSVGIVLWAILYIIFVFLISLKWKRWRAAVRFKKHLVKEGMPKDLAGKMTDSQFKSVGFISIWRWWRALGRGRKREHRR